MARGKLEHWDHVLGGQGSRLAAFIRRRVRQPADASDLTQEVYLRFLRADREELIRNPEAYLYTVAVNLLREQSVLARRWAQSVDASQLPTDPALVNFRTPEEEVDREARMSRITALVESLPPKLLAVLVLQYRDGLTYQEIAARLGVTTHTVKKYVMQGLAICRKRLMRAEGDET
jgi:RNA polymerase sigma-70 factor (ECF subfamily)